MDAAPARRLRHDPGHRDLGARAGGARGDRARHAPATPLSAAKLDRHPAVRRGLQLRHADDAAAPEATGRSSPPTRRPSRRAFPSVRDFIVGNEPNLNRFWLPQFSAGRQRTPPRPPTCAARRDLRRAEGGLAAARACYGGALAPRGGDRPDTGATRIRRRPSSATSAPPTARAAGRCRSWTRSRSTRTARTRASPPTSRIRTRTSIGVADYGKLVALLGAGVRRHGAARLDAADPLRRVRRRDADPGRRRRGSTPAPSRRRRGRSTRRRRRRSTAQALADRVLPAERRRPAALPRARRDRRSRRWQSGVYYADGTPKTSLPPVRGACGASRARRRSRAAPGWS